MNEPIRPRYPMKHLYEANIKKCYIYRYVKSLREDDDDEDEDEEQIVKPAKPVKDISEVTLTWLIEQLPENMKHKDVKIEFGAKASSFAYESHYVNFYYEVEVPERMEDFKLAMTNYQLALKQYEKDLLIYEEYCNEQEIKKAEEKLAILKKRTNSAEEMIKRLGGTIPSEEEQNETLTRNLDHL